MTKKHLNTIASLLRAELEGGFCRSRKHHGIRCRIWADALAKENPQFNEYLFLKACGAID